MTLGDSVPFDADWLGRMSVPFNNSEDDIHARRAVAGPLEAFSVEVSAIRTRLILEELDGRDTAEKILNVLCSIVVAGVPFGSLALQP